MFEKENLKLKILLQTASFSELDPLLTEWKQPYNNVRILLYM